MLILKNKRLLTAFLIMTVLFSVFPKTLFSKSNPWDPYSKYIPAVAPVVQRELRGAWICTVVNMDWPSDKTRDIKDDKERIQKSKDELLSILDRCQEMKLNAVFFQVSPTGDAFYKSSLVPWSRYLTGTFGKDPGFDPLLFAVEEAHKRNLEMHAWFNPYRVSMNTSEDTVKSLSVDKSVYKEHPEWIKTAADRFVIDPGIPEARDWVMKRVMEVVNNYDIDGIHFDDYFYNEEQTGEMKDTDTFNKYNNGQFSNLGDFRRNNNYLLVKELSKKIRDKKSWVKFGISPSGVWGNKKEHDDGSNTNTSYTNYEKTFADTKKWVEEELIDYIAPQIYFTFANTRAPYGELATWWSDVCRGKNVQLYIGLALYKVNDDTDQYFKGSNAAPELSRQLKFNLSKPGISGSILFRYKNFNESGKQSAVDTITGIWSTCALVPQMPWKGGTAPLAPVEGMVKASNSGNLISWADNDQGTLYYAIYRFNSKDSYSSGLGSATLIGTVRKNKSANRQEFIDKASSSPDVYYAVTSLDRLHNESGSLLISGSLSKHFMDVGRDYTWAFQSIDSLFEKGIIKGSSEGIFDPGKQTKRCDFMLMIVRALNLKADYTDNFKDAAKGSYYYDAVGIAKALGVAKGSDNRFNPESNITREDMMVIIARACSIAGIKLENADSSSLDVFSDKRSISGYAVDSVACLVKAGLVKGSDNLINPKSRTTRAEIAVILDRVLNYK